MEQPRLFVAEHDITRLRMDAIVNSYSTRSSGRDSLNRAVQQAAGHRLGLACQRIDGIVVGTARLTLGYRLPAKYVIHTVVPTSHGPTTAEEAQLRACYRACLNIARLRRFKTIAFPVLGSGTRGFQFQFAATIALTEIQRFLEADSTPEQVIVTIYDSRGADLSLLAKQLLGYYMDEGVMVANKQWIGRRTGWWIGTIPRQAEH